MPKEPTKEPASPPPAGSPRAEGNGRGSLPVPPRPRNSQPAAPSEHPSAPRPPRSAPAPRSSPPRPRGSQPKAPPAKPITPPAAPSSATSVIGQDDVLQLAEAELAPPPLAEMTAISPGAPPMPASRPPLESLPVATVASAEMAPEVGHAASPPEGHDAAAHSEREITAPVLPGPESAPPMAARIDGPQIRTRAEKRAAKDGSRSAPPPPLRARSAPPRARSVPPPLPDARAVPPGQVVGSEHPSSRPPPLPRSESAGSSPPPLAARVFAEAYADPRWPAHDVDLGYPPPPRMALHSDAAAFVPTAHDPEMTAVAPLLDDGEVYELASPDDPRSWLIDTCRRELAEAPGSARAARLHYEIARLTTNAVESLDNYRLALQANPSHVASIQGLRRILLIQGAVDEASKLFDEEIRLAEDTRAKARLYFDKGRAIEDLAGDLEAARVCYLKATQLDQSLPVYFKALEQAQHRFKAWSDLAHAREGNANAVRGDSRHRAAIIAERARLLETRTDDVRRATELYEQVLDLDPRAASGQQALKRLLYQQSRWRELIAVLEREATQTNDNAIRTQALFRIGRIHGERLGSRVDAIHALARAMQASPTDRLVLDTLARTYEAAGEYRNLANVLAHTVETIPEPVERLSVMHRIGMIHETRLGDDEKAQGWYEAALQIDPAYMPAVSALDGLYERAQAWESLIVMHLATTEHSESARRAAAHARIAGIFETRVGRPEEAIRHHAQALSLDATLETSFKALVRLYALHQRHRELIELYERGIDQASDVDVTIAYLFKIGGLYEDHLADPAQSVHAYKRILALQEGHLGALHALQRACERACRYGELVEALELEAQLTSDKVRRVAILQRAGDVLANDAGDREAAVVRLKQVLSLNDKYAPALTSLGKLYHELGRHSDRRDILELELNITPKGPRQVALLHKLGELCEVHLADDDQAIAYYRRAIALDNTHGVSLRALAYQLRRREDYKGLVGVLQAELIGETRPELRSGNAYRLGEVYEVHLEDHERAVKAYEQALEAQPNYRPAIDALARVRSHLRHWQQHAEDLLVESARVRDVRIAVDALLRAGEIYAELLEDPNNAASAFERVRALQPDNLAALLALEPIYRERGAWDMLAEVYMTQAGVLGDPRARVAVLEELARVYERHAMGTTSDLQRVFQAILSIDGTHLAALRGLEYQALINADVGMLADIDARYARAYTDQGVIAAYQTRLGESLEVSDPNAALQAYRTALEHDAENIAAIRGLGRAAERCGDAKAMIEACRREASWTRVGELAADVLVKSARVRVDRLNDHKGAIDDAERALERYPDHAYAAVTLGDLLREAGEIDRLITLLSRAAGAAQQSSRVASLWRVVARLYADEKNDIGAALASLDRLLEMHPDDPATLRLLGDMYVRNRQWNEAADAFKKAIALNPEPPQRLQIELALGRVYANQLKNRAAAVASLRVVLEIDPAHRAALLLLLDVYNADKDHDAARLTVQRLLQLAAEPTERAWALEQLGRIELRAGRKSSAAEALRGAVAITGPQGDAAREYKKLLGEEEPWEHYVEALQEHLRRVHAGELQNDKLRDVYMAIARIQHEVLLRVPDSIKTLRAGLEVFGEDLDIHHELAERLSQTGRADEAIAEYRRIVNRDPASVRAWRGMARAYHESQRKLEAGVALAPLVILGEATEIEGGMSRQRRVHSGHAHPASFDANMLQLVSAAERWEEMRIASLFEALGEALTKMYPVDFESYGVTARDKLRPEHPLKVTCDRLASIFCVQQYDLFLHAGHTTDVVAELSEPPALMVPRFITELPDEQQVFMLARAFVMLARNMHAVVTLGWREMARIVTAALRTIQPSYGAGRYPLDELDGMSKRLVKALSRKNRKMLELAAQQCLSDPAIDVERWGPTVEHTSARAGALLANDLPSVISVLRQTGQSPASLDGPALVRTSSTVADLFRFWSSETAFEARRVAGIL